MRVISLSLDKDIAVADGEARNRQRRYADHFDSFTVIVKTSEGRGSPVQEDSLHVEPTFSSSRYAYLLDAYRLASKEIRQNGVDVLTVQDPFAVGLVGLLLKRRFGIPLHTQVHTDFLNNPAWRDISWEHRIFNRLGQFVLPRSDVIRVGTRYEKRKVEQFVPEDVPVMVSPVHIDLNSLVTDIKEREKKKLCTELGIGERPIVLFVGRFVPVKNLEKWMAVASKVIGQCSRDPVFVLVGDGPELSTVKRHAREHGIEENIRLPGWLDPEDVATYYEISDVFLITSIYEGTSRVIVEAGMNELPVVATPFAGSFDNVEHGETGYRASETEELAYHVVELLENEQQRKSFGRVARNQLEDQFRPDRLVDQYVKFLKADVTNGRLLGESNEV